RVGSGSAGAVAPATWGVSECVAGIAAVVGAFFTLTLIAYFPLSGMKKGSIGVSLIEVWLSIVFEFSLLLISLFLVRARGGSLRTLGWRARRPDWLGPALLAVVCCWITLLVYTAITSLPGLSALRPSSNVPEDLFGRWLTVVPAVAMATVVAPICE